MAGSSEGADRPEGPGWWAGDAAGGWVEFQADERDALSSPEPLDGDVEVRVVLTEDERVLLVTGLNDWGGPAHGTDSLAVALGFSGLSELHQEGARLMSRLQAGEPFTVRDWSRALAATEIVFASSLWGTGSEWTTIQGGDDSHWVHVLRSLQLKVPASREFLGP